MRNGLTGVVVAAMISIAAWAETVPDFADDFTTGTWASWKAEGAIVAFAHNQEVGNRAPGALEIAVGPNNPLNAGCCFLRRFTVKPGQTYTALVYVRAKGIAPESEITLGFQGQDAEEHFLGTGVQCTILKGDRVPTDGWKRMVLSMKILDTGKWQNVAVLLCTFGISNAASGQVFFDDVEFFQAEE